MNCPYEYVLLFMHVTVDYVMLYMYAEKLNKFKINSNANFLQKKRENAKNN